MLAGQRIGLDAAAGGEPGTCAGSTGGETIQATNRDRIVAQISPPRDAKSPVSAHAILAEAVSIGWLTPPTLPATRQPQLLARVTRLGEILDGLDADRRER